mmetsp:Transcript_24493/g.56431  ORF Transcript_24493/g.56431 Transcript_24493/m.56431 type:complete len:250 (+) Transcript_24493:288-1037(+)
MCFFFCRTDACATAGGDLLRCCVCAGVVAGLPFLSTPAGGCDGLCTRGDVPLPTDGERMAAEVVCCSAAGCGLEATLGVVVGLSALSLLAGVPVIGALSFAGEGRRCNNALLAAPPRAFFWLVASGCSLVGDGRLASKLLLVDSVGAGTTVLSLGCLVGEGGLFVTAVAVVVAFTTRGLVARLADRSGEAWRSAFMPAVPFFAGLAFATGATAAGAKTLVDVGAASHGVPTAAINDVAVCSCVSSPSTR